MQIPAGVNVSITPLAGDSLSLFYGRLAMQADAKVQSAVICTFYLPTLDTQVTPVIQAAIDFGSNTVGPFPQGPTEGVFIYSITNTPEGDNLQYIVVEAQTLNEIATFPCWCNLTVIGKVADGLL